MVLGPEHVAQRAHRLIHELDEIRIEVAHEPLAHRGEHPRIRVARSRAHEEPLGRIERRYGRFAHVSHVRLCHPSPSFCASPIRWSFPVAPTGISVRMSIFLGTLKSASFTFANS